MRTLEDLEREKNRLNDRVLVIRPIEGKKPMAGNGVVDGRLFTGGNNLRAVKDEAQNLWYFKYDKGSVPEPLKCWFTSFTKAKEYASKYLKERNLEIVEVQD